MKKLLLVIFVFLISGLGIAQDEGVLFKTEEISFTVGKYFIKGDLVMPLDGKNFPAVVMCFGSGPTDRKAFIENSMSLRIFIREGFAFFVEDKPGSGESTGEFLGDSLFYQRAMILEKEIEILKKHPLINPKQIGLYGSSQAGYVMPLVLEKCKDVSFMIAWSCPAMSSVEQSGYLVMKQSLCNGDSKEDAEKLREYYVQRGTAKTYKEYFEAAQYLDNHPVIKELGWGGIIEEKDFAPSNEKDIDLFNPIEKMYNVKIPVLAIFGERDTQVDPVQGANGYKEALQKAVNGFYKIVTIPGADHNMRITKTGSLKEQKESYNRQGGAKLAPEFLETLKSWLGDLKKHFSENK